MLPLLLLFGLVKWVRVTPEPTNPLGGWVKTRKPDSHFHKRVWVFDPNPTRYELKPASKPNKIILQKTPCHFSVFAF